MINYEELIMQDIQDNDGECKFYKSWASLRLARLLEKRLARLLEKNGTKAKD